MKRTVRPSSVTSRTDESVSRFGTYLLAIVQWIRLVAGVNGWFCLIPKLGGKQRALDDRSLPLRLPDSPDKRLSDLKFNGVTPRNRRRRELTENVASGCRSFRCRALRRLPSGERSR
jgi:hypothetical protein